MPPTGRAVKPAALGNAGAATVEIAVIPGGVRSSRNENRKPASASAGVKAPNIATYAGNLVVS